MRKQAKATPAKKSTSRKPAAKKSVLTPSDVRDKDSSVGIRKIENGYLITESGTVGKGKNRTWFNRESFSPTNPLDGLAKKIQFGKK